MKRLRFLIAVLAVWLPTCLAAAQPLGGPAVLNANGALHQRINALADAATITPLAGTSDIANVAALSQATTVANPTGTVYDGQALELRITTTVSRALTWGTAYAGASGIALPTATTANSTDYLRFRWNSTAAKFLLERATNQPTAPPGATYVVQTASNAPTNAQILANLSNGLPKLTAGVFSIATPGVDYPSVATTITAGTGMTGGGDLSASRTMNVVANADGSITVNADDVQVGILATDAQHGVRGGGTQHAAVVSGGANGFMLGTDKALLDTVVSTYAVKARNLVAGAGLTGGGDLTADRTFDVIANADGSIVVNADDIKVGVITDTEHGTRAGGTLHAAASDSTAGFMSAADHTTFSAIPSTYAPLSRLLTAGSGLSGGGTLAADRTFTNNLSTGVNAANQTVIGGTLTTQTLTLAPNAVDAGGIVVKNITSGDSSNAVLIALGTGSPPINQPAAAWSGFGSVLTGGSGSLGAVAWGNAGNAGLTIRGNTYWNGSANKLVTAAVGSHIDITGGYFAVSAVPTGAADSTYSVSPTLVVQPTTGNVAIGQATRGTALVDVAATTTQIGITPYATVVTATGAIWDGMTVAGSLVLSGSTTTTELSGTRFKVPAVTGGTATVTTLSTVTIDGCPTISGSSATNCYALNVKGATNITGATTIGGATQINSTLGLTGDISVTKSGTSTTTFSGTGVTTVDSRTTTSAQYGAFSVTSNSVAIGYMIGYGSTWSTSGPLAASTMVLYGGASGGINLAAGNAAGQIGFYTGGLAAGNLSAYIPAAGGLVIARGAGALATSATDGMLYQATMAGAATGTATTRTGGTAEIVDSTNGNLSLYLSGWRDIVPDFQGSDIASATTITLGAGKLFKVTGTTTVDAITTTSIRAGRVIYLWFTGNLTIKNNTAGAGGSATILLQGGVDFTTTGANGTLTLFYNGTNWIELARTDTP